MKIASLYRQKMPISFEIFPPKGDLSVETLRQMLDAMKTLSPDYVGVTYSAGGGGNSGKTAELSAMIQQEYGIETCAHLTCINGTREEIDREAEALRQGGVENILALRGDVIPGKTPTDFFHASELLTYLSGKGFCLGAACYPEGHVACENEDSDLSYLKIKEECGASFFISQLFFDNSCFYRFLERCRHIGITVPIDAGIMPFLGKSQVERMIFMCGASLPAEIIRLLNRYEDSPEDLRKAGIEYAAKQILDLASHGADGIHIYTMNHADIAAYQTEALRRAGY